MAGQSGRLFLEQVFECFACIVNARRAGGGFFFHHDAHGVEGARVLYVFAGNAFHDWLTAFKPAGGIEIGALLAGVQLKAALRALSGLVAEHLQHGAALGATRDRSSRSHLQRARSEGVLPLDRLFARRSFLLIITAVHVSGLAIFPVRHGRPPPIILSPTVPFSQLKSYS